jgi:hypothetical protein
MSYTLSQAMEHAMPEEPNDTYIVIRALVALITVTSMTTMGLFGIGWALSPRAAR